jgi:3-oxoadipate CoA-transferase, beta subunit
MMEHCTKTGEPKLVERCSYPLTGLGCVSRVYTDLAVLDISAGGVQVRERAPGVTLEELQARTGVPLLPPV